jgi:hypothetical protein
MAGAARDAFNFTTADHVEAIGMRVLRIAEEMSSGSRHQGRSCGPPYVGASSYGARVHMSLPVIRCHRSFNFLARNGRCCL